MTGRCTRLTLFMLGGLAVAVVAVAAPSAGPMNAPARPARATVDPQPPLALAVELAGLQEHARGGIATIVLRVSSVIGVDRAVVTAKVPDDLRFADGSREKVIPVDLSGGGERSLPIEILAPRDGRFTITAEVEGTAGGRAVRRGSATTLFVGRRAAPLPSRDGAIEYVAAEVVEAGEVQP